MMKRQTWFAGLLSVVLFVALTAPAAWAEIFHRTITLGPGAGNFAIGDLGVGDSVVLTLVNPTNRPLVFETTENIGNNKSWTVPANGRVTVDYTYTKPFDDDVEFVVKEVGGPDSPVVARGTFIPAGMGAQDQPAAFQQQPQVQNGMQMRQMGPQVDHVRGYW